MLNIVKMELYRLLHTKSLYIIWIVLAAAVWFSTAMSKEDYKMMQKETSAQTVQEESINLGMSVTLPTKIGQKVTFFDQVYANLQGKFVSLFLVIFAVIFSTADFKSGYIKHIGGQIHRRWYLILAKSMVLMVYTACSMIYYLLVQALFQRIYFSAWELGDVSDFWSYVGTQFLLNTALVFICMALAILLASNVFSMTLSVCLCMNVLIILYSGIDKILMAVGVKDFHMIYHTVTGKMSLLPMNAGACELYRAVGTALVFGAAAICLSCIVFEKRDIR